ncbi:Crp/Fnr family transcriptional regulator [Thioclava sp.]|uniref:Crp/Fnr family transcriptional regulator n=1 Tax=Thioclava sp. TaxID=1933450 RepID=UPI003AA884F4
MTHWHLESIDWLDSLPDPSLRRLRTQSTTLEFRDGQTIFSPIPDPDAVFILEQGLVRIYRLSSAGGEFTFGYVKPGEVFGELAAYDTHERDSFACAIDRCTVLKVPVPLFRDLLQSVPELGFSITKQIEKRFKQIERRAEDLVFRSVAARLADVLLMLMEEFGEDRDERCYIRLHLTQAEFATLIGAARPTVNQTFHQFRKAGLASFEKGHVVIIDAAGLRQITMSAEPLSHA